MENFLIITTILLVIFTVINYFIFKHVEKGAVSKNRVLTRINELLSKDVSEYQKTEEEQRFLAEADVKILSLLDYNSILKKVSTHAVPRIADLCVIHIVSNDDISLHSVVHRNIKHAKKLNDLHNKLLLDKKSPINVYESLKTKEPQLLSKIPGSLFSKVNIHSKYYQLLKNMKIRSIMTIPLVTRGTVNGMITLASTESHRTFNHRYLSLVKDLVSRTAIAIDNAQLYQKAQEAIKAREEFLSLASHELKTPLTSLLLELQIILRSINSEPLAKLSIERLLGLLKNAEQQTKKLSSLIGNLLNISRITGGRLNLQTEKVDLNKIVEKVLTDFKETFDQNNITVDYKHNSSLVGQWDPLQIDQVVTNLVSNAIKYGEGEPIEVKVERDGLNAKLTVRDHGIGIDTKHKDDIFKPFTRIGKHKDRQGLGIGLYIVSQIIQAHGGKINTRSQENEGSSFVVDLPINTKLSPAPVENLAQ